MAAYSSPVHLPEIAGMVAVVRPDFDREQWTTCYIGRLAVGSVFALPDERLVVRPVVLTETRTEDVPGEVHPWVIGVACRIDTGAVEAFKLRASESVLSRCDLHYVASGAVS